MDALVGCYLLRIPLPFALSPHQSDRALVIVETRPSFFLPQVVASAVRTHPGWRLYVFGSPEVHALLGASCKNYECATRVQLGSSHLPPTAYSRMLLDGTFWECVKEEHILVFQADCVLVRPTPAHFLKYDYVGAVCGENHPRTFVMNGGLSLRRRSAMVRALRGMPPHLLDAPEDAAFCEAMRRRPGEFTLPTREECCEFAIETIGDASKAVGLHGTDKYYAPPGLIAELLGMDSQLNAV